MTEVSPKATGAQRSAVSQILAFVAVSALLMFGGAALVALMDLSEAVVRAVWISAGIAFVVQVIAFLVARFLMATNPLAGWGLGAVLRFVVLLVYAFVGLSVLKLDPAAALISLAAFLFLSTIVEAIFLKS